MFDSSLTICRVFNPMKMICLTSLITPVSLVQKYAKCKLMQSANLSKAQNYAGAKLCKFCDWESFAICKICVAMQFAWVQDYANFETMQKLTVYPGLNARSLQKKSVLSKCFSTTKLFGYIVR